MDKKIVMPGEELATVEEFECGENTFSDDESVYSDSIGKAKFDSENYEVSVTNPRNVKLFTPGTQVLGVVGAIRKNYAFINIREAFDGKEKRVFSKRSATLLISSVSSDYIKNLSDMFKKGDIVRAEIESIEPYRVTIKTNKPELGVVKAFCSKCRAGMLLSGEKLMCTKCGSVEDRKLSTEYSLK